MLLGGTIAGRYSGPEEWEELLVRSRFRAVTAPFSCHTPRKEAEAYAEVCRKHGVVIAEIGVWKNVFDPDPAAAKAALDYAAGLLPDAADRAKALRPHRFPVSESDCSASATVS